MLDKDQILVVVMLVFLVLCCIVFSGVSYYRTYRDDESLLVDTV